MNKTTICLDAGHASASYNQSPVLRTYFESTMNWTLHLLLKAELEKRGFEVITTRLDINTDLTVYSRGTAAKGCNVFVSLHSNACGTESVDYPVVYRAYDNLNGGDTLALAIAQEVGRLMDTKQAGRTATRKNSSGGEYYGVLRGARTVGVPYYMLIEHSFHTNLKATEWLSDEANLTKLAVTEAEILAKHFGVSAEPTTPVNGKTSIMGSAAATAAQMALYCRSRNASPLLTGCTLEQLAELFLEEGRTEGVRGDVAFAQSLKETGCFKYGGIVLPTQNNFAGIGALNGNAVGNAASFSTPQEGIRAQIQHLKAYASTSPLNSPQVDPRFHLVARGCAPYVEWLGASDNPQGRGWAVPGGGYGAGILSLLSGILAVDSGKPSETVSGSFLPGDKVVVKNALQYGSNAPFRLYYNEYDVISVVGDRVVIGIGKTVTAAVHAANLENSEKETPQAIPATIKKGDKVKVLKAVQYGTSKTFQLYHEVYDVIEVKGNRIVIGIGKDITAAVHISNLTKL